MSSKQQEVPDNGIETPDPSDIISGKGLGPMNHPGNKFFREVVQKYRKKFLASSYHERKSIPNLVIDEVQRENPSGRFLKQDMKSKLWYILDDKDILEKTRVALRQKSAEMLDEIAYERYSTRKIKPLEHKELLQENCSKGKHCNKIDQSALSNDCVTKKDQKQTVNDYSSDSGSCSELRDPSISLKKRARIDSLEQPNTESKEKVMQIILKLKTFK